MTDAVAPRRELPLGGTLARRAVGGRTLPILAVLAALVVVWFAGAVYLNAPRTIEAFERQELDWTAEDLIRETWSMDRPVLPTPAQVFADLWANTIERPVTSRRSLVYHAWVTLSSTLLGFAMGAGLGIVIAVGSRIPGTAKPTVSTSHRKISNPPKISGMTTCQTRSRRGASSPMVCHSSTAIAAITIQDATPPPP